VIICAYTLDRWDLLGQAVASVHDQTLPARETIVVIDGNDELFLRAEAELTAAIVLRNGHRRGLSGARQTGAEAASAPILAFLDDDAVADRDWLSQLVPAYDDPDALGAGGPIDPIWLDAPPRWLPPEFNWIVGCTYAGMRYDNGRIRNLIGANMSLRAEVLQRSGGFEARLGRVDQGTPVSGTAEETEFCIRAARMHPGGYWAYRPAALVRHAVPPDRTTWRYFVRRCRVEGTAKAVLTGFTGSGEGLASERAYTRSVLPRAVGRDVGRALRGDRHGLQRAGAIVAGLSITAFAYAEQIGRFRWRQMRHSAPG